jgi:hypothetical protein
MRCVSDAWQKHEAELLRFLRHRARVRLKAHLMEVCLVSFDATGQVAGFVPRPPKR